MSLEQLQVVVGMFTGMADSAFWVVIIYFCIIILEYLLVFTGCILSIVLLYKGIMKSLEGI